MKKIIIPVLCLILGACSSESDLDVLGTNVENSKEITVFNSELNLQVTKVNDVLTFENEAAFKDAVTKLASYQEVNISKLKLMPYTSDNVNVYNDIIDSAEDITLKDDGFHSIYDDFVNAMNEAEEYYDSPGGYEEFKKKYSMLYFPEEGDDYSAYLPVSNKNIAKLLNSKGEVIINGKVVNLTDIHSYKQLIDLGIAPIEENYTTLTTKATTDYPLNKLPEVRCNDRKLWVNTHVRPGTSPGVLQEIQIEVCFRKKGFLGAWYNYSSETILGWEPGATYHKSGYSSHDYLWARIYDNGVPVPFTGLMYVQFQGFGAECGATKYYFRVDL
ncbi:DUF4848 domain-containing protein [Parabacteroides sp. Marseille-P3160]|uniref:DUF4848 domain-containing protein n=1 Tax=Parabacteroides sp. Marseille-P3160 TaxID=1917887 RepID=UPI0009BA2CB6|nr:DUF4848 domain-containing protein [Parabacteroides sp. Marseille-P3160]